MPRYIDAEALKKDLTRRKLLKNIAKTEKSKLAITAFSESLNRLRGAKGCILNVCLKENHTHLTLKRQTKTK